MSDLFVTPHTDTPGAMDRVRKLMRSRRAVQVAAGAALNASLALFVSVSCLSLLRVFVDAQLQIPILIGLASGLAVPAASRVLHVPSWLALAASAITEFVVLGAWYSQMASRPLSAHTFSEAREAMIAALQQVNQIVAPSPSLVGFGITVSLVSWLVGLTADLMCFGIPSPLGALVTPSAVFIAAASLTSRKDSRHQSAWMAAVIVSLGLYLIAIGLRERSARTRWFADRAGSLLQSALVLGMVFAVVGFGANRAAQHLAFDTQEPAVNFRVGNEVSSERVIASPLVSLQRRLLNQSNSEQFTVSSKTADGTDVPSYWRLTALDEFNGESWQSTGEYRSVGTTGRLTNSRPDAANELLQHYVIADLGTESLPAAYVPVQFEGSVKGISFAADTATLLAGSSLKPQTTYFVTSSTPQNLDPGDLAKYNSAVSDRDLNVNLPVSFPDRVRELAVELTKDQPTTVQKALALQNFFRTQFVYSLDVPAGSGEPALERFLFTDRTGYCEQFAGAFAAMARSIGIPARVAVGFTPGRFDRSDGLFHVTGKNSHAWPEIRLANGVWFPFEPTPGRGFPGLQATTGVAPQDLSERAQPLQIPTTTLATPATSTTVAPGTTTPPPEVAEPTAKARSRGLWVVLLAAFAAAVGALIVFAVRRRRGSDGTASLVRRVGGARTPSSAAQRIDRAWVATERRIDPGVQPSETEEMLAARLADEHPELPEFAVLTQRARYGESSAAEVGESDADRAEALAMSISGRATGQPERSGRR